MQPKILAFAGSTRAESLNKKLVRIAAEETRAAGSATTLIDLRDYALPLYDGDLEAAKGLPANALKLKELFMAHQGLLISSPEYNAGIPGVLKNAIDWVSRSASPDEPELACFENKTAALMSASPGALGGMRGLVHLRLMLSNIRVLVLPGQVSVPRAHEAFDAGGSLKDARQKASVQKLAVSLVEILKKLHAAP